jgi:hypothetical protein
MTRHDPPPLHSSIDVPPNLLRAASSLPRIAVESHTNKHVVVVADRFASFTDGERVLTISELLALVSSDAAVASGGTWLVHVGQGMEESDWQLLESACGINGRPGVRIADREALLRSRVAPEAVHKVHQENVLLANLRNLSRDHCVADLRIHPDNELVLDHNTCEHVPGMVIIEAIRQIGIAQFETACRPGLPHFGYTAMWKGLSLSFQDFLFAIPATVVSEIVASDLRKVTNLGFRARVSVWQNGGEVVTAELEYAMIKQERFRTLERRRATQATEAYLNGFAG